MVDKNFIGYVGSAIVHDAKITNIVESDSWVTVSLESEEGETFIIQFIDVVEMESSNPMGMMLYAISEVKTEKNGRKFAFVNWDDEDDSFLEIISKGIKINVD